MRITITIDTDNAAFHADEHDDGTDEVMRILRDYTERVSEYGVRMSHGNLIDANGNTVGRVTVGENEGGDE
jgi:D-mannonate dehydratase